MGYYSTNDDYKLYYDTHGDRSDPPIVFLYDLGGKRRFFDRQLKEFARDHYVIRWDYRAHGSADSDFRQLNPEQLAEDLSVLFDDAGLGDNICVAASGLGAGILLAYIRAYGDSRLSRIVLMDETLKYLNIDGWTHGTMEDELEAVYYMREMSFGWEKFVPRLVEQMIGGGTAASDEERKMISDAMLDNRNMRMMALMVGHLVQDLRDVPALVKVPVLVTYGRDGGEARADMAKAMAEHFANSSLADFKGGTMHYYLDAESFNKRLRTFLAEEGV